MLAKVRYAVRKSHGPESQTSERLNPALQKALLLWALSVLIQTSYDEKSRRIGIGRSPLSADFLDSSALGLRVLRSVGFEPIIDTLKESLNLKPLTKPSLQPCRLASLSHAPEVIK